MSNLIFSCYSVYNEEALIRSSLDTIVPYVDEVIVGDGAYRLKELSRDETMDIVAEICDHFLGINRPGLTEVDKRNAVFSMVPEDDWIFWIDGDEVCVGDVKKGLDKVRNAKVDLCRIRIFNNGKPWTWLPRFIRSKKNFHLGSTHWIYKYGNQVIYEGALPLIDYIDIDDFFIINCNALRPKNRQREDTIYKEFMSARKWDDRNKDMIEVKA